MFICKLDWAGSMFLVPCCLSLAWALLLHQPVLRGHFSWPRAHDLSSLMAASASSLQLLPSPTPVVSLQTPHSGLRFCQSLCSAQSQALALY